MPCSLSRKTLFALLLGVLIVLTLTYACAGSGNAIESPWDVPRSEKLIPGIGKVAWFEGGDDAARTVAFVHGTPGNAAAWSDYLGNVPPEFNFIALDRPGFGASTTGVVPELSRQASALVSLLPETGGKAILVGHSLGGPIIARAAVDFPDRVGALVIVAGSLDPGLEKINPLQYIGRWWPVSRLLPRSLYNSNLEIFALEAELELLKQDLGRITIPVIIIHGTKDRLVPYENVVYMKQTMINAAMEVVTLEGQNHFLPWNSKDVVDEAIRRASQMMDVSTQRASLID